MQRKGKTLKVLAPGDRRRMSDGKNAWRKMTDGQRRDFLNWIGLRPLDKEGSSWISQKEEVLDQIIIDRAWEKS